MPRKATLSPLAERIEALGITTDELSQMLPRRSPQEVAAWVEGSAEPGAEATIELRVLDQDHVATLAVQRIRSLRTHDMRGDGMVQSGIEPDGLQPPPILDGVQPS